MVTPPTDVALRGSRLAEAKRVVVLVHGRDQDPDFMVTHVIDRLEVPDVAYVLPRAPQRRWYPAPFLAPLELNATALDESLQRLDELHVWLEECGRPPGEVMWCGFSQGASLVTTYVARRGLRCGGLVAFTGGLIGPPGSRFHIEGDLTGMPVYMSASAADDWLPVDRAVETASVFRAAGAQVRLDVFQDRGHEISDAEIDVARQLMRR